MLNKSSLRRRRRRNNYYIASAFGIPVVEYVEIGREGADTVVIKFSSNVISEDYSAGITIKVNDVSQTISDAVRQDNHSIVFFTIPDVVKHDIVTLEYASASGDYTNENDGSILGNISPYTAINNVPATIPIFVSGEVISSTEITITFSENIILGSGGVAKDGVVVTINETPAVVTDGVIADEVITYTLVDEIVTDDVVTFAYDASIGSLQSELDNIPVQDITPQEIDNGL